MIKAVIVTIGNEILSGDKWVAIPSFVKALTDKIEILEKFRTIVEKTHSIIQAAFIDMRASAFPEKALGVSSETAKPEEASRWSKDEQEATDPEKIETETYHYP